MSTWIQVEGTSYVGKLGKLFRRVFSMLHSLSLFLEILNFVFLYTDSGLSSAHGNGDSVVHLERSDQLSLFGYTAFSYRGIHSYEVPDDCFHVERRTSIVDIRGSLFAHVIDLYSPNVFVREQVRSFPRTGFNLCAQQRIRTSQVSCVGCFTSAVKPSLIISAGIS